MARTVVLQVGEHEVPISNPEKVYFPEGGYTKLDLAQYYLAVGEGALRGVAHRPVILKRFVDGISEEPFFQKRAPASRPPWISTARVTYPSGRSADLVVADEVADIVWMANLGCVDLNPWPVRADDVDHPDELRIDLDPTPAASWDDVRQVALLAGDVLREHGLEGFPKTSGSRGIHINVRIERRWDFNQLRRAALALAREIERRAPDLATSAWWKEERHGVFIDYNQNARDRTVASAYSVRAVPDARVSCPLTWDEVPTVDPAAFTIETVPARFRELGDLASAIDDRAYDLTPLLELSQKQEAEGQGDAPWPPQFRKAPGRATPRPAEPEAPSVSLPFQPPVPPMLSKAADGVPTGEGWLYEPKWDGFRVILFWDGGECMLQSRDSKPLGRYFPELLEGLPRRLPRRVVLDGELVIEGPRGLDFGALQQRIHPAESRIRRLAAETPASYVAFDLLALDDCDLRTTPLEERHDLLRELFPHPEPPLVLTPSTRDPEVAVDWFHRFEGAGFDGVIAKRLDDRYREGERTMLKVKHRRTADCVVAGLRWHKNEDGVGVGSLLLGLYDDAGVLHHVGHTSSFTAAGRRELTALVTPYMADDEASGFGLGRTPGTPSRWSGQRNADWVRLRPELVCEVAFDHMQGDRFRHGTTFQRWRPDKPPLECTYDQLEVVVPTELRTLFAT